MTTNKDKERLMRAHWQMLADDSIKGFNSLEQICNFINLVSGHCSKKVCCDQFWHMHSISFQLVIPLLILYSQPAGHAFVAMHPFCYWRGTGLPWGSQQNLHVSTLAQLWPSSSRLSVPGTQPENMADERAEKTMLWWKAELKESNHVIWSVI